MVATSARSAELSRTCVIGAGSSGLAVAKALIDAGVPFD
jgi:cation diffusion facilitator CzcD-associated flavoprotein CzcO